MHVLVLTIERPVTVYPGGSRTPTIGNLIGTALRTQILRCLSHLKTVLKKNKDD